MAINIGQSTFNNPTPVFPYTSYSSPTVGGAKEHVQLAGADGFLYVEFAISGSRTVTSASWGTQALTFYDVHYISNINIRHYRYYLANPSVGRKSITVNFNGAYTTSFVWVAQSFTNCGGINDSGWSGLSSSVHTDNPTVADDDLLYGSSLSLYPISRINIDSTNYYNPVYTAHSNVQGDQYVGQLSSPLTAGITNVSFDGGSSFFQNTNSWVKFTEAGGEPPVGSAEGSWWLLMRLV
jgi:hypothetical protein